MNVLIIGECRREKLCTWLIRYYWTYVASHSSTFCPLL